MRTKLFKYISLKCIPNVSFIVFDEHHVVTIYKDVSRGSAPLTLCRYSLQCPILFLDIIILYNLRKSLIIIVRSFLSLGSRTSFFFSAFITFNFSFLVCSLRTCPLESTYSTICPGISVVLPRLRTQTMREEHIGTSSIDGEFRRRKSVSTTLLFTQ